MIRTNEGLDIEALLQFHRETFGDARMEGEEGSSSEGAPQEGETGAGESGTEGEAGNGSTGSTEGSEGEDDTALPDWAQRSLKAARADAANYRTRLRDAEAALADLAKNNSGTEDFQKAVADLQAKNAELEKLVVRSKVARQFSLPDELAELLKGDDEKAMKEHAKQLQKFASPNPRNVGGGLNPNDEVDDVGNDPRKLARRARRL